jgi:hypothetical protein
MLAPRVTSLRPGIRSQSQIVYSRWTTGRQSTAKKLEKKKMAPTVPDL